MLGQHDCVFSVAMTVSAFSMPLICASYFSSALCYSSSFSCMFPDPVRHDRRALARRDYAWHLQGTRCIAELYSHLPTIGPAERHHRPTTRRLSNISI